MNRPIRIGVLGAGMISTCGWGVLPNLGPISNRVQITAITSPTREKRENVARQYDIPRTFASLDEMLAGADIDAVLNLTPIPEHDWTSKRILEAGKHLVTEKPITATIEAASELIDLARSKDLLIISSPPRMVDPTRIVAKRLIQEGAIGQVAFAKVRSSHAGPAAMSWPSDPAWSYQQGAGPLLDLGVYGLQEITGILGPARRVTAVAGQLTRTRTVVGGSHAGAVIPVTTDDNILITLDFGNAVFAQVDCTFSVRASQSPPVEIFGLDGTIVIHESTGEGPRIELYRADTTTGKGEWIDPFTEKDYELWRRNYSLQRAVLLDHLVTCLDTGQPPVLSAEHARHTLEIMLAAQRSAIEERVVALTTTFGLTTQPN